MPLAHDVVDVFLSTMNTVPGQHAGPAGRLTDLIDCQIRRYQGKAPERVVVEARNAFASFPSNLRDSQDGSVASSGSWASSEMLHALDRQLVSVCAQIPRVFTGSLNWTWYGNNRILTDKLSESVYHTSDHTIQVPDGCWFGNVTCFVWTETTFTDTGLPIGSSWLGFKSDAGTWVTLPRVLYQPDNDAIRTLAKTVTDGQRFWVFWNSVNTGVFKLNVAVYDINGQEQAHLIINQVYQGTPGYWDVTYQAGTVLLAQEGSYAPGTDTNVLTTKFSYSSGTITPTSHLDTTMHCQGPVQWVTNDVTSNRAYLATIGLGDTSSGKLYGYEIDPSTLTQTHEYNTQHDIPGLLFPDSITGYVASNTDLYLSYSLLATAQTVGPVYDPALRSTTTILSDRAGTPGTVVRTSQGAIQVSRAFKRDNDYYVYTYYQSGSGLVLTQTAVNVSITPGDYMLGNASQAVTVKSGDFAYGATQSISSNFVQVSTGLGSTAVHNTDSVATDVSDGTIAYGFIPSGTPLLKWSFVGAGIPVNALVAGGRLVVSATTGVTGANATWDILGGWTGSGTPFVWTLVNSTTGTSLTPGTFNTAGNFSITACVGYYVPTLPVIAVDNAAAGLYVGGAITVTGFANSGNNVTAQSVIRCERQPFGTNLFGTVQPSLWVVKTTQVTESGGGTVALTPFAPNRWDFEGTAFAAVDVGSTLTVQGDEQVPSNNGVFTITGVPGTHVVTTGGADADGTLAQVFGANLPGVTLDLPLDKTPYTFYLQSVTLDYTYYNALVQVKDAIHPVNNGVYQITFIDPTDAGHHTFVATPTNGKTDQVNESFNGGAGTSIVIQLQNGVGAEFQPCWFITPVTATQAQVGCFERGLAFADWRFEGETGYEPNNVYPMSVSSPFRASLSVLDLGVILPYRAKSFTAGQTVTTPTGTVTSLVTDTLESTIGLKEFRLHQDKGQATEAFQELLLPGPLAGGFTESGFHEQGFNLGPEAPFLVSESNDTGVFGMTSGNVVVQAVYELTDENGERVYSYPSPALSFVLQSPNNTAVYGGRLPFPLDTSGSPVPNTYGITNRSTFSISLYRTATVNGVPTTQRYKVTNDLNPLGLYNGSGSGSGFTFPDSYTWNYRDQSLDTAIVAQESLYTSRGLLPRFPAPANSQGDVWENRTWLVGYDGAVWLSGDKGEGDGNWFFPGFRIPLGSDTAVTVSRMEQYLVIGGQAAMWYIPAQQFPNNTGTSGSLPTPSPLPFPNGCTGHSATIAPGVVYSSTAGGVWLITRDLKNIWLSEPIKDKLTNDVTGITVDKLQRVAVADGTARVYVYDPVPGAWYIWRLPTAVRALATYNGNFVYQDTSQVNTQVDGDYTDNVGGVATGIAPDLTLAGVSFAKSRNVKRLWEMQLVGEYKGPHNLNAVISYPDDYPSDPTSFGPFPVTSDPGQYLWAINPKIEEAGQYVVRVFASYENFIDPPGNSFALELLSCQVGVDTRQGLLKRPSAQRVTAN